MEGKRKIIIELEGVIDDDTVRALRNLLKRLLRNFHLRCTGIRLDEPATEGTSEGN